MKIRSQTLQEFIDDFHFNKEDLICFDATIIFLNEKHCIQIESEVHLVSTLYGQINTLYILDAYSHNYGVPDMLNDNKESFSYIKNKCLVIEGQTAKEGNYVISIYPIDNNCRPGTLKEIRQKHYN